jgi:N-acetylglucosamine kinase-like BadF-type ATPase
VEALPQIVPVIHSPSFTKERFANLARDLAERAEPDDQVFQSICERAGQELAAQALVAVKSADLQARPAPVYLVGGVLTHDALVRRSLLEALNAVLPIQVEAPRLPPVLGAAAMALADAGLTITPEMVAALKNSITAKG